MVPAPGGRFAVCSSDLPERLASRCRALHELLDHRLSVRGSLGVATCTDDVRRHIPQTLSRRASAPWKLVPNVEPHIGFWNRGVRTATLEKNCDR